MNRKTFLTSLVGFISAPWRSLTAPKAPPVDTEEKIGSITYRTFKTRNVDVFADGLWEFRQVPIRYRLKDGKFEIVDLDPKKV